MLKYRLLQERLRDLLTKALAGGPSALREAGALKLTSGPCMAGQAAAGPSAAAGARLQQTTVDGGAGGSRRHLSSRLLWTGSRPPALQHRTERQARAQAAAGGQWRADGPHASIHTAGAWARAQPALLAEPLLAEPPAPRGFFGSSTAEQTERGAGGGQPAAAAAAAAGEVAVQGTVHKVTFRAEDTGYTVFRLQLAEGSSTAVEAARGGARRRRVITVVGTLPPVAVGQALALRGAWVEHAQYGKQLKVSDFSELSPTTTGEMEAYLGGGAIAGVGPATAKRLVDRWGADIESKLSSPAAVDFLQQCDGIGRSKAEKIKRAWDATKGTREGVMFLKEHGIPLPLAQRIARRHGPLTVARVRRDPYLALAGCGLPFSKVDVLASRVGAPADLVSRAALAMRHCLSSAAANEGHTHLPWHQLARGARQLLDEAALQNAQPWQHHDALHLVAQHMHAVGSLVAEPEAQPAAGKCAEQGPGRGEGGGAVPAAAPAKPPSSPAFDSLEELRAYVEGRLSDVGPGLVDSMVERYGLGLPAVLDAPLEEAVKKLSLCRRIGPKTAEKVKAAWEAARGLGADAGGEHAAGAAASSGLTMARLLAEPPVPPFAWGPDTRCYSPPMHVAECTVAGSALQRAAAYCPPTARQTARVRKWSQANQSTTALQLSEGQVRALEVASDAPLMVLTGGPGCGKTTVVQTIVKLWAAQNKVVRIAAPTGRAAQRMGAMQGIDPCTIHRLLGYQPRGAVGADAASTAQGDEEELGQGAFLYNKSNPLTADAVLVDEASMLSLPLAAALFDALLPRCQLVLVGDVDQLPPVGPGSVLQSLIASRLVPVVDLREIFRQAAQSAIITSALAVRRGDVPLLHSVPPEAAALAAPPSDALLVPAAAPGDLVAAVRQSVVALRQAHMGTGGPEPDLQVITPMRKGPAGTATLNPMLQALLNPPARVKAEVARSHGGCGREGEGDGEARCFRVGDAVIQLVNDYDKEVFNGDQGRVVACLPRDRCVRVHFPHLGREEGLRQYRGMELSQLELAYAVTVHKAQGGESAHVVLALSPQHGRMLTRRLLYTGLTRAKRQLVVVCAGSGTASDPLVQAVRQRDSNERLTWLRTRLEEGQRERSLPQLAPQSFSNEEQMLAQAARWRQQGLQAGAEAGPPTEPAARNGRASAASPPGPLPEAEVRRQLQQREGLSDEETEEVVQHLRRHAPQALADWDRATAAAAWLGERLGGGAGLRHLARAAPQLLEADVARLRTCWSFLEQRPQFEAGGGGGVLEGLHALRQQQQQQRAQAG